MLTLYYKPGCQFCQRVLDAGKELELTFNLKNVRDEDVMDELVDIGGKDQVPYLIDDEGPVEMYESSAIVTYLHHTFGNDSVDFDEDSGESDEAIPGTCTISDE